jgi:hypothetical protein
MPKSRRLLRLRKRYLTLLLGFTTVVPSVEAAWGRARRGKVVCGAVLLSAAAAATAGTLWFDDGKPTTRWKGNEAYAPREITHGRDVLNGLFQFSENNQNYVAVLVLEKGWMSQQVAEQVKAKLVSEFPEAVQLPDWTRPGLRVPLSVVTFQVDAKDGRYATVKLSGPFVTLYSLENISVADLHTGKLLTSRFTHHREDIFKRGIVLKFDFQFRYEQASKEVGDVRMTGTLEAFGPFFSHVDQFETGPLRARPVLRIADK